MSLIKQYLEQIMYLFLESCPYMLLGIVVVFLLRMILNPDFFYRQLGGTGITAILKSILWGLPLPICSCGVIPLADFLYKSGISRGVIGAFLVATPTNGIDSILVTYGMLGSGFAMMRPVAGGIIAILVGLSINYCGTRSLMEEGVDPSCQKRSWGERWKESITELEVFFWGTGRRFIVGMILLSPLYYILPNDIGESWKYGGNILIYVSMILLGLPLYICSTSSVPIAFLLIQKGFSNGAAFVFLTAGPLSNLGVMHTMTYILGKRGTFIFYGVSSVSILFFAWILDQTNTSWLVVTNLERHSGGMGHGSRSASWSQVVYTTIFLGIFLWAHRDFLNFLNFLRIFNNLKKKSTLKILSNRANVFIEGMVCQNCEVRIEKELRKIEGIRSVSACYRRKEIEILFESERRKTESLKKCIKSLTNLGYVIESKKET